MKAAIISTGNELLNGSTINTNLAFLGRTLSAAGIEVACGMTAPDSAGALAEALRMLAPAFELIITTGGLGPTSDDITRQAVCETFGLELKESPELRRKLEEYWRGLGRGCPPSALFAQALLPENAVALENRNGTAPGLWLELRYEGRAKIIVLLPGPPSELEPMVMEEALPRLATLIADKVFTEHFMVAGAAELLVQREVEAVIGAAAATPAYCASAEGVRVFLSGTDRELLLAKAGELKTRFGAATLANDSLSLVEEVSFQLRQRGLTLATAESCTGGMMAAAVTSLPGASNIFKGSVVAYDNEIKERILAVPAEILRQHGAVSAECVAVMAEHVRAKFGTDAGIAVSGIAGPGGATPTKPAGLVFIGVAMKSKREVRQFNFRGARDAVRLKSVANAFLMLRELLFRQ